MNLSDTIRKAALGEVPDEPYLIFAWGDEVADAALRRLNRIEEWWNRNVRIEERRMFLLFCAEDCES